MDTKVKPRTFKIRYFKFLYFIISYAFLTGRHFIGPRFSWLQLANSINIPSTVGITGLAAKQHVIE
jgi:hypothetical protein